MTDMGGTQTGYNTGAGGGSSTGTGIGRAGFWILIALLAISGVAMAFIAMFGLFDTTAFSLVWRVFVADLYLIASLAAQHRWLRWTAWIGTAVTFVLGLVSVFWRFTPYYQWADGRSSYRVGDYSTGWSPWFGFEQDLEAAGHIIVIGTLLLGFVSLAYRWIASVAVLRAVYIFTFVAGMFAAVLGAWLVLDSPQRWDTRDGLDQLLAGTVILALTAAAIVIIAAFVQRSAALSRLRAQPGASLGSAVAYLPVTGAHSLAGPATTASGPPPAGGMSAQDVPESAVSVASSTTEWADFSDRLTRIEQAVADLTVLVARQQPNQDDSNPDDPRQDPELLRLISQRDLIAATKRYRVLTGVGLAEAKAVVDSML